MFFLVEDSGISDRNEAFDLGYDDTMDYGDYQPEGDGDYVEETNNYDSYDVTNDDE